MNFPSNFTLKLAGCTNNKLGMMFLLTTNKDKTEKLRSTGIWAFYVNWIPLLSDSYKSMTDRLQDPSKLIIPIQIGIGMNLYNHQEQDVRRVFALFQSGEFLVQITRHLTLTQ